MTRKLFSPLIAAPLLLSLSACGWIEQDPASAVETALESNDFASARVHLAKLVAESPQDSELRIRYADVLLNLGDAIGAQAALEQLPADMRGSGRPAAMMAHAMLAQDKAQDALTWASQADPDDSYTAWVTIGAKLAAGLEEEAFTFADAAVKRHADNARLLALRGEMALAKRNLEQAKRFADQALTAGAEDFAANTLAGKLALLREEFETAERFFTAAIAANPSTPGPYHSLGAVQADLGKFDEAEETLETAAQIAPEHPMGMFLSAKLAFVKGDLDQAHAIMQQAEANLRGVSAAQLLLGEIAHLRGNQEQAIAFLRPFLRDNPGHVHGATVMAQALVAIGDPGKAMDVIEGPAARATASPQILSLASRLAKQTGREDIYASRLGAKAPPAGFGERLARAGHAMNQRDWKAAREIYAGLRKDGMTHHALLLNNSALAELYSGNKAQAIELARQASALTPDDPQVKDTMGWVLLQGGGNKAEALRWIGEAKAAMPGNLEIRWHYAAALAANGRKDEARRIAASLREFGDVGQREHIDALLARL